MTISNQFDAIRQSLVYLYHIYSFLQYTRRSAAEVAAEKTFNKLTIKGKKLSIRWGKSQGKQDAIQASGSGIAVPQVPGLPGKCKSIYSSRFS